MRKIRRLSEVMFTSLFISGYSSAYAGVSHIGATGSLVIGPSWTLGTAALDPKSSNGTPLPENSLESTKQQIKSIKEEIFNFYDTLVTDADKVTDFDWSAGAYYTFDFGEPEAPGIFGVDCGVSWFSKTNTINLKSSQTSSSSNIDKNSYGTVESLTLERQGVEAFGTFKIYVLRSVIGSFYTDFGPIIQYSFLNDLKEFKKGKSEKMFEESDARKNQYFKSFNLGIKFGVGARLLSDVIEVRVLLRHWFMEGTNRESDIAKEKALSRYHFGDREWDAQISLGINFFNF